MTEQNPLDAANEVQPQVYFGQILLDAYFCALIKGTGKVPYDPAQHDKRFTAINLTLAPFAGSKATYSIERQYVAEFKEWTGTVLPSIHAVGLTPTTINKRWVQVEMVKTGTYIKKIKNENGEIVGEETKDLTSPKIVAVFDDEAACANAANTFFTRPSSEPDEDPFPAEMPSNGTKVIPPVVATFLSHFVKEAAGDVVKLETALKGNSIFVDHGITITHPVVVQALSEYEAKQLAAAQS